MRIFLVRHGQSHANVDWSQNTLHADASIALTEEGHKQAQECGRFLKDYFKKTFGEITGNSQAGYIHRPRIRLWHSPYKRAVQTAEEIVKECVLDVPPIGDSWFTDGVRDYFLLREQEHGVKDGLSDEEWAEKYPAEWAYYQKHKQEGFKVLAQLPLGESRIQVATRVHQAFGTFQRDNDKHGIDNIVVVAHGTTNRCFAFAWLHKPLSWLEEEPNPWNCSVRLIENSEDKGYIFKGFSGGQHAGQ